MSADKGSPAPGGSGNGASGSLRDVRGHANSNSGHRQSLLDGALSLAAKGKPVFPCWNAPGENKHKTPMTKHGFKDATTDTDTIKGWWTKWPEALIAMRTGAPSGIDVCDLDTGEKNGEASGYHAVPLWKEMTHHVVITESGGAHLYFRASGIPTTARKLAPNVDTRGEGGYVIVPPSPGWSWHNGQGGSFTGLPDWPDDLLGGHVRRRREIKPLPPLPQWLRAIEHGNRGVSSAEEDLPPKIAPWKIDAALAVIPSDDYQVWFEIGCALRKELGDEEGWPLFDAWSQKSSKYDADACRAKWANVADVSGYNAGTIFFYADLAGGGWREATKLDQQTASDRVELVCVADVAPRAIRWLWRGRIALGKLTILAGHPGVSKSILIMDITARVTTERAWPCREGSAPLGSVVIVTNEDAIDDTIRPRLDAARADVRRVHVLRDVITKKEGKRGFDLTIDADKLEAAIRGVGDVVLVVIDPITAYMGKPGKLDSHRVNDVRSLLLPYQDMASRLGCAFVGINHLTKSGNSEALMRSLGSIGMAAAARAAYLVAKDKEAPDRRLFLPMKNNIGDDTKGFAFTLRDKPTGHDAVPRAYALDWEEEHVTITANQALMGDGEEERGDGRRSQSAEVAAKIMAEMLRAGPRPAKEIEDRCRELGIGRSSLRTAREKLGVKTAKHPDHWEWYLPGQEQGKLAVEPVASAVGAKAGGKGRV